MILVVFDIDGTLIQSCDVDTQCYTQALEDAWGISEINTDWGTYHHTTDAGIAYEIFATSNCRAPTPSELAHLEERFLVHLADALADAPLQEVPGARDLLSALAIDPRCAVAIATGGWQRTAHLKLDNAGFACHRLPIATSNDHFSRDAILKQAIERAKNEYKQTTFQSICYVGDGAWDARSAAEVGCRFVGRVAPGYANRFASRDLPWLYDFTDTSHAIEMCLRPIVPDVQLR